MKKQFLFVIILISAFFTWCKKEEGFKNEPINDISEQYSVEYVYGLGDYPYFVKPDIIDGKHVYIGKYEPIEFSHFYCEDSFDTSEPDDVTIVPEASYYEYNVDSKLFKRYKKLSEFKNDEGKFQNVPDYQVEFDDIEGLLMITDTYSDTIKEISIGDVGCNDIDKSRERLVGPKYSLLNDSFIVAVYYNVLLLYDIKNDSVDYLNLKDYSKLYDDNFFIDGYVYQDGALDVCVKSDNYYIVQIDINKKELVKEEYFDFVDAEYYEECIVGVAENGKHSVVDAKTLKETIDLAQYETESGNFDYYTLSGKIKGCGVYIKENYAYIQGDKSIKIVDIKKNKAKEISSIKGNKIKAIEIADSNTLYVATKNKVYKIDTNNDSAEIICNIAKEIKSIEEMCFTSDGIGYVIGHEKDKYYNSIFWITRK